MMSKSTFFIALFLITLPVLLKSQNNKPTQWTLNKEVSGIQIFYKYQECNNVEEGIHQELVLLRFVNTSNVKMQIKWTTDLRYNTINQAKNVSNNELQFSLDLGAGEVVEGNCDLNCSKSLRLFSKFLNYTDKSELIDFKLHSFQTIPL